MKICRLLLWGDEYQGVLLLLSTRNSKNLRFVLLLQLHGKSYKVLDMMLRVDHPPCMNANFRFGHARECCSICADLCSQLVSAQRPAGNKQSVQLLSGKSCCCGLHKPEEEFTRCGALRQSCRQRRDWTAGPNLQTGRTRPKGLWSRPPKPLIGYKTIRQQQPNKDLSFGVWPMFLPVIGAFIGF